MEEVQNVDDWIEEGATFWTFQRKHESPEKNGQRDESGKVQQMTTTSSKGERKTKIKQTMMGEAQGETGGMRKMLMGRETLLQKLQCGTRRPHRQCHQMRSTFDKPQKNSRVHSVRAVHKP